MPAACATSVEFEIFGYAILHRHGATLRRMEGVFQAAHTPAGPRQAQAWGHLPLSRGISVEGWPGSSEHHLRAAGAGLRVRDHKRLLPPLRRRVFARERSRVRRPADLSVYPCSKGTGLLANFGEFTFHALVMLLCSSRYPNRRFVYRQGGEDWVDLPGYVATPLYVK